MCVQGVRRGRAGEEEQEALGEIGEGVEDGGFGVVEARATKGVDYERAEESAVEVVGLGRHFTFVRERLWCFFSPLRFGFGLLGSN